jgi:hypothetical protein
LPCRKIFGARVEDAKTRVQSACGDHRLQEARLLPSCLNQIKRCRRPNFQQVRRKRNARESAARTEIGKRSTISDELVDERECGERIKVVPHGALARVTDARQIDRWIPRVKDS